MASNSSKKYTPRVRPRRLEESAAAWPPVSPIVLGDQPIEANLKEWKPQLAGQHRRGQRLAGSGRPRQQQLAPRRETPLQDAPAAWRCSRITRRIWSRSSSPSTICPSRALDDRTLPAGSPARTRGRDDRDRRPDPPVGSWHDRSALRHAHSASLPCPRPSPRWAVNHLHGDG